MFNVKWGAVAAVTAFVLALLFSLLFGKVVFLTAFFRALIFAVLFFALGTGAWILISSFLPELLFSDTRDDTANIFASRETTGSRVDITVGSGAALPDSGGGMSGIDEVGDISDLISGKIKPAAMSGAKDMDQIPPSDYTNNEEESVFSVTDSGPDSSIPDFSDFSAFTGGLAGTGGSSSAGKAGAAAEGDSGVFGDFGAFTGGDGSEGGKTAAVGDFGGFTGKASASDNIFDDDDIFSSAGIYSSGGTFGSDAGMGDEPERKTSGNKPQEFEGDFNPKEIAMGLRTVLDKDKKG